MFCSTIDHRRLIQRLSDDLNTLSPLNPLSCFIINFETILVQFLCILGYWYISGFLFILHWRGGFFIGKWPSWKVWLGHAYTKRFRVACSAIHITNHCYQSVARLSIIVYTKNHLMALWEGDLSLSKVYEGPLCYAEETL